LSVEVIDCFEVPGFPHKKLIQLTPPLSIFEVNSRIEKRNITLAQMKFPMVTKFGANIYIISRHRNKQCPRVVTGAFEIRQLKYCSVKELN
jgi:hypothetical protein